MKSIKLPIALICGLALSGISFAQSPVSINSKVVSSSGMQFLQQLDNKTEGYPRALRNQQKSEFDVLSLMVMLNQTANIEDKLNKLVSEQQKTNKLLAQIVATKSK